MMALVDHTTLDTIVQQLLAPVPGDAPAGRWLRYEPVYMATAKLREEDNPDLPMGEWERPLVKADWRKVADACAQLLAEQSKDFQIAGWLADAWLRTAQMPGLCAGLALISGLARQFWDQAWPTIEDDDADRRVAPFVWMNTNLPQTMRAHVVLLPAALHRQHPVTQLDWERAPTADDAKSDGNEIRSRRAIRDSVKPADADGLQQLVQHAETALADLDGLTRLLDERLQRSSPSLSKLSDGIDAIRLAAHSLLQELPAQAGAAPKDDRTVAEAPLMPQDATIPATDESAPAPVAASAPSGAAVEAATPTTISDRAEAYAALNALADYLQTIEPHSPTPYMVRRAVQLGQLSLPQMVKEVSASAGSLDKFFELLGIAPPN